MGSLPLPTVLAIFIFIAGIFIKSIDLIEPFAMLPFHHDLLLYQGADPFCERPFIFENNLQDCPRSSSI